MGNWFREARKPAGLPDNLVLYCGRHDYGARIFKKAGNLAAVMRTMDHKDVKTAMQYQHPELKILCVRRSIMDTVAKTRAVAGLSYGNTLRHTWKSQLGK